MNLTRWLIVEGGAREWLGGNPSTQWNPTQQGRWQPNLFIYMYHIREWTCGTLVRC